MKTYKQLLAVLIGGAMMYSCSTNILDETVSITDQSYVSVILNSEDPQIMSYDDGNIQLGFYGEKIQGLPMKLGYVSYKGKSGGTSLLKIDSQGRIVSFIGYNNVSMSFKWNANNSADIMVSDPSTDLCMFSKWIFSDYPIITGANWGKNTNIQIGEKQLSVQIQRNSIPCAAEVILAVVKDSITSYLLGNETSTKGHYSFRIPNYSRVTTGNPKLFGQICNIFETVYTSLYPISMIKNSLKETIEKDIVTSAIQRIPSSIIQATECFSECIDELMRVANYSRTESSFINHFNPTLTTINDAKEMRVLPYVNGVAFNNYELKISDNQIPTMINIELDDGALIDEIELTPSSPSEGVGYNISFRYLCVPIGSTIEAIINGSDGYNYSTSVVADNNSGYMSIDIPGTYNGVYETCTFNIIYNQELLRSSRVLFQISFMSTNY